jgi:hypothetical protein
MIWHTVDGIFFGAISIYLYKRKFILSGLIFLIITMLTKQSFMIFSIIFALFPINYIVKKNKIKKNDIYLFFSLIFILTLVAIDYKLINNFHFFQNMVFSNAISSSFYKSSIMPYFFQNKILNIILIIFLVFIYFAKIEKKIIEIFIILIFSFLLLYAAFNNGIFILTNTAYLVLIMLFFKFTGFEFFTFSLILLGWTSTISWGGNLPLFFIFILMIKFLEDILSNKTKRL